jgi:hypothetical protein
MNATKGQIITVELQGQQQPEEQIEGWQLAWDEITDLSHSGFCPLGLNLL